MSPDPRPRSAAALVGVAAIGLTTAGWLDAVPGTLRSALLLVGVWVVPAYLLVPLVRRWCDQSAATVATICFFLVLSLHAIASELMRALGASFTVYASVLTWVLLLALLAVLVTSVPRGVRSEWSRLQAAIARERRLVVALLALVVIAAWWRGGFTVQEDAFDHIGFVRRIVDFNAMRPEQVLAIPVDAIQDVSFDPRKGALHPMIAWVATGAGVEPDVAWSALPLVLYPALVFAFVGFTRALLGEAALVAIAVALFALSYGGTALQFAHSAAYGQNLAAGWYWVLVAVIFGDARALFDRRRARLGLVAVLAFGGSLAHVGVALHVAILAASMVVFAPWLRVPFRAAAIAAGVVTGASAAGVVARLGLESPQSNAIHAHVQGVMFVGQTLFVTSPMEILRQFGMTYLGALVLVPLVAVMARRRSDARAVVALCALPIVVAFVPPVATELYSKASYMLSRALLNAPVFAAAAIAIAWMVDAARRRGILARAAAVVVLAAWSLAFVRPAIDATRTDFAARSRPAMDESLLPLIREVDLLPGDPVVLADPATSYLLSAYCSSPFVGVYEQHGNPRDPYALERLQAMRDVVSPFADSQRAVDACKKFGVRYVVLNGRALAPAAGFMTEWDPALFDAALARLRALAPAVRSIGDDRTVETSRYAIFQVFPGVPGGRPPESLPAPVVAGVADTSPCTLVAPEGAFEVTGIAVAPPTASPGESVTITIGYRRDVDTPFALPSLAHLRFDHESIVAARPFVGDKYVRRFEERRQGYVARFRTDVRPGGGVFEPDLWPMGTPLHEVIRFAIPHNALPGRYQVEVRIVRDSLLPNFHARDLLFNRDHYSGIPCASVEVRAGDGEVR